LAYELLTGQQPFPKATPQAVLVAHAVEKPAPLAERRPDLPPLLSTTVMRLLEKRPDDRPQSAEEVIRILDGVTTPSGGSALVAAGVGVGVGAVAVALADAGRLR